jgi:nucleotide-binding universal stress UspA family protein
MRYLVATDGRGTNAVLRDYLEIRIEPEDTVFAVHSLKGQEKDASMGEEESDVVVESREVLEALADQLAGHAKVETHQLVRGNDPHEDILLAADEYDADEIVIGIRQRSAAERTLFGSNAQKVLMNADRPVVGLPLGE